MKKTLVVLFCGILIGAALFSLNQTRRAIAVAQYSQETTKRCIQSLRETLGATDTYLGGESHGRRGTETTRIGANRH